MTFKEAVAALAQKLGVEIAVEGDACALRASAKDGTAVTIWMQGSDERGTVNGAHGGRPRGAAAGTAGAALPRDARRQRPVPRHRWRHAEPSRTFALRG